MPGINDDPEWIEEIVGLCREAGATFVGTSVLHLRGEVRDVFFGWLEAKRPDLLPEYERLYSNGRAYLPPKKRNQIASVVKGWRSARRHGRGAKRPPRRASPAAAPKAALQEPLF
jgi:DNA repair photolyase